MKEEELYQELIGRLKKERPMLESPEELTGQIIHRITTLPIRKKQNFWLIQAWLSGAVAVLLICILLTEQRPLYSVDGQQGNSITVFPAYTSLPRNDNFNLKEETFLLRNVINERREARSKREVLYRQVLKVPNIHLKTDNYESK